MRVKLRVNEGGGGWVEWRSEGGGQGRSEAGW